MLLMGGDYCQVINLIDSMGDDLRIVNAARVSFAKSSGWELATDDLVGNKTYKLREADKGLINYLMRNRHGTPFEMVVFTFHVECPIGVAREWQRHRIGSFNEMSTRYVEMAPACYIPYNVDVRTQVGKPGHYTYEHLPVEIAEEVQRDMQDAYNHAHSAYQALLAKGVAKELARNVLPLGQMTQFYWTVNLRSLFNFLSLRTHETALLEIRQEANPVLEAARKIVPASFDAWETCGRLTP